MHEIRIVILALWTTPLLFSVAAGQDSLPRALILGDSVYQQPAGETAKSLKGKVDVVYGRLNPGEVWNTTTALEKLDELLGKDPWDVIHFNCGLGDLVYRVPNLKSFRVLPIHGGGVRATDPTQYEKNLRQLTKRLRMTGAELIWGHTTPIRHSSSNVFEMGSEIEYNAIATKVMAIEKVSINDMYTYTRNFMDMDRPASHGADPFYFDRKPLHPPIEQAIVDALGLKK